MPKTKLRLSIDITQGHACSYNNCKYGCSELFYSQSELDELKKKLCDKIRKDSELTKAFNFDKSWIKEDIDSVFDEVTKK